MIVLSEQMRIYLSGKISDAGTTLPREAVRMTSGVSDEVATAVTQPE